MKYPPTPESDKLLKVADVSNAIGAFIDWLAEEKEIEFCRRAGDLYSIADLHWSGVVAADLVPVPLNREKLLAEYYDIDLNKVEAERRKILDYLAEQNAA